MKLANIKDPEPYNSILIDKLLNQNLPESLGKPGCGKLPQKSKILSLIRENSEESDSQHEHQKRKVQESKVETSPPLIPSNSISTVCLEPVKSKNMRDSPSGFLVDLDNQEMLECIGNP